MNQRLADAIQGIQRLPEDRQDDLAEILEFFLAQETPEPEWTPAQLAQIRSGIEQADRGEFVSDERLAELFPRLVR